MQLIKIHEKEGKKLVSAKELYLFLGYDKKHWARWYKKNITDNDFLIENIDYETFSTMVNGNESFDFSLTIDTSKRISMMARSEKGEEIRKYFIECEKQVKSITTPSYQIEDPIERAKHWIKEQEEKKALEVNNKEKELLLNAREEEIKELLPKASYYDVILSTSDALRTSQIAQDYGLTANKLNKMLHAAKVQRKVNNQWVLNARYSNMGLHKSSTHIDSTGKARLSTMWTQKGRLKIHEYLTKNGIEPIV